MTAPHTIAEAWAACADEWGVTLETPGYADARNLFYSGAAAMLASVATSLNEHTVADLVEALLAELKEYFDA
jgi:hypothetical protein